MDQDSLRQIINETAKSGEVITLDWQPIIWIGGVFFSVITGLLGWIVWLIASDRTTIVTRMDKHEEWIMQTQTEIKDLARTTGIAIQHGETSIEFVKEMMKDIYKNRRK